LVKIIILKKKIFANLFSKLQVEAPRPSEKVPKQSWENLVEPSRAELAEGKQHFFRPRVLKG